MKKICLMILAIQANTAKTESRSEPHPQNLNY